MAAIKASPTDGICYNPSDPLYWEKDALEGELERVFDICQGCRMCFNLCGSFPALFDAVDANDGDVRKITDADRDHVADVCFQCKLCYVKCPYTADDGHDFNLDFPRLMLRFTLQRARERGVPAREKMLGDPVTLGKRVTATGMTARIANLANSNKLGRRVLERATGIHRDKKLPSFATRTFESWVDARARPDVATDEQVVLFHTCFVNYNAPQIGMDAVEVLERNGIEVLSPAQTCCGMPALDGGDFEFAREQARRNVMALWPYVERGYKVLVINPTCSYMMRKEYAEIVGPSMEEEARRLSESVRDVCEFLFELKKAGRLDRDFKTTPGEIAYHIPCHLRAQGIGYRSRDVMKTIPGAKVKLVDRCCGHDGTWAMKKENFEASMKIGRPAFDAMQGGGLMTTDCPLAAVQFEQATGTKPLHPVQVLARAYRSDGFDPIPAEPADPAEAAKP